jgi:hypothetical protein
MEDAQVSTNELNGASSVTQPTRVTSQDMPLTEVSNSQQHPKLHHSGAPVSATINTIAPKSDKVVEDKLRATSRERLDDCEGKSEDNSESHSKSGHQNHNGDREEEIKQDTNADRDNVTKISDSILMPRPPSMNNTENSERERSKSKINRISVQEWKAKSVQNYEMFGLIGKGTFGKVFKAKKKHTVNSQDDQEIYALKKLNMAKEEEGFPITALREIQILRKLNHENVVKLKEVVTDRSKILGD